MKKLMVMWWLSMCLVAAADTHYVRPPETCTNTADQAPYTSWETAATNIQWAMNAAAAGDLVLATDGVYAAAAQVSFPASINLAGVNGPDVTAIDGENLHRCVYMPAGNSCLLSGFTLTRGNDAGYGGGAFVAAGNVVSNCVIRDNIGAYGGGIRTSGGMAIDCLISNNVAVNYGGGVFLQPGTVAGCTIASNYAPRYAGAYLLSGGIVSNCVIRDNLTSLANWYGSGVYLAAPDGSALLTHSIVSGNVGPNGAGVRCSTGNRISHCTIASNRANLCGGVYITDGCMSNCTIIGNTATGSYAGGVFMDSGGVVRNCLIHGNHAANFAGGVYVSSLNIATGSLSACTIVSNQSVNTGAGLVINRTNAIVNCMIAGNVLTNGVPSDLRFYNNAAFESNSITYSRADSAPPANGNITDPPQFQDAAGGDYRLRCNSPGVDAGLNESWMGGAMDLNGRPRLDRFVRRADMGAYETVPAGALFLLRGP